MTNDDLVSIERLISSGGTLPNSYAKLLLEQLRSNAAEAVRVNKVLADAERRLEMLAKVTASTWRGDVIECLEWERGRCISADFETVWTGLIALLSDASPDASHSNSGTTVGKQCDGVE